ncbi:hypothetical protein F5148DRAFT_1157995 [Russula earlei]|uniref:Uncharacterized protein n=1 Tax=Russula earlei TaxID=71964 RepID=A0ACC0UP31_9AGAM|nr:hypothetical protein F5148DRAFT_1157995 [Russula earlei]
MKVNVTREEFEAFDRATIRGSIEGIAAGLAISIPASLAAQRYLPAYRALPLSLKALGAVLVVGPAWAIQTERRGVEFDEEHNWKGVSRQLLDNAKAREASEWDSLSTKDRFSKWVARHQYKVILGSWAAGMAVAGTIIMRDRHQSTSQKIVQARMWAQGLTIGVLIAAGVLTHSQREDAAKHHAVDHSWREILEAEMREAESRKVQ